MNYKELEKSMQQKLHDQEINIDTNQFVSDFFGKKKRSRPIPLWFLAGAAFLLTSIGGYFAYIEYDSNYQSLPSHENAKDLMAINGQGKSVKVSENSALISKVISNEISPTKGGKEGNDGVIIPKMKYSNKIPINSDNIKTKSTSSDLYSNSVNDEFKKIEANNSGSQILKGANEDLSIVSTDLDNEFGQNSKVSLLELSTLPSASSILILTNNDLEPQSNLLPGVKCPSFKTKKPIRYSLIPEIGYFYPLTTFGSSGSVASEVLDIRKKNETTLEGIQAALYGKVGWKAIPWYFKSGLNYGRITRRMDLDLSFVRKDTTIGIISITESQNGDTLTVIRGPIITDTKVTRKEVRHYYHHLWSIPIVVGYQKNYDYFSWAVEAGINFNMSSKQTGFVMTTPNEFGLVNNAGLYKSKVGISYLAQIQVGRFINEHNMLGLALRANINPNNFANNASTIDEKYQMIGINLFYEFKF